MSTNFHFHTRTFLDTHACSTVFRSLTLICVWNTRKLREKIILLGWVCKAHTKPPLLSAARSKAFNGKWMNGGGRDEWVNDEKPIYSVFSCYCCCFCCFLLLINLRANSPPSPPPHIPWMREKFPLWLDSPCLCFWSKLSLFLSPHAVITS